MEKSHVPSAFDITNSEGEARSMISFAKVHAINTVIAVVSLNNPHLTDEEIEQIVEETIQAIGLLENIK